MIQLSRFSLENETIFLSTLSLNVQDGEIFMLVCKESHLLKMLFNTLQKDATDQSGQMILGENEGCDFVDRIVSIENYDSDTTVKRFVDKMVALGRLNSAAFYDILLEFNIYRTDLNRLVKDCHADVVKAVLLGLSLAGGGRNLIINDFALGGGKDFELKFNSLLLQKRKKKRAILYLCTDIFYAMSVADRLNFIKEGYLMPSHPILAKDLKEMDVMKLYDKYMN